MLRATVFENAARILLKREEGNNFIFIPYLFDSIDELQKKYRLKFPSKFDSLLKLFKTEWKRCDLIEFVLNNTKERIVENILFFEVKTKLNTVERPYFEQCPSNHKFMQDVHKMGYKTYFISVVVFDNWRFSFNILPYQTQKIRVRTRFVAKKK